MVSLVILWGVYDKTGDPYKDPQIVGSLIINKNPNKVAPKS